MGHLKNPYSILWKMGCRPQFLFRLQKKWALFHFKPELCHSFVDFLVHCFNLRGHVCRKRVFCLFAVLIIETSPRRRSSRSSVCARSQQRVLKCTSESLREHVLSDWSRPASCWDEGWASFSLWRILARFCAFLNFCFRIICSSLAAARWAAGRFARGNDWRKFGGAEWAKICGTKMKFKRVL